jgi:large subunit ribosomal protein L7/L12
LLLQDEDEEDAAPRQEQVAFTVKLTKFDEAKKVQLIKAIKGLVANMNLVQVRCMSLSFSF